MKTATDVGLQTWEADVTCGVWCQGGSVRWLKTDHPQYTDASDVWVRGDDAIAALESLRAELAVERKRQSAMRTLIASQEGTLSHYRSKQAEADEAIRTLDSERQANATLTAELAECKEDAERYRWLRNRIPGSAYRIAGIIYSEGGAGVDAGIDAARKGEEK